MCRCSLLMLIGMGCLASVVEADTDGRIRLQVGCEVDTNPIRSVDSAPTDELLRLVAEAEFSHVAGRHGIHANYLGGLKLHFQQDSEDLIATQLGGLYSYQLSPASMVGIRASIADASLRVHDRDYFVLASDVVFGSRLTSWFSYMIHLGGSYFLFKPDGRGLYRHNFTHYAPTAEFVLRLRLIQRLSVSTFYQVERRAFDDRAYRISDNQLQPTEKNRIDLRHTLGTSVRWEGEPFRGKLLVLDTSYSLSINDSNSEGSSAHWHRLKLALSMQLPLNMSLHLVGTLQLTSFKDAVIVDHNLYEPDADEKENSLVFRLHIPIVNAMGVVIQAGFYRNDFHNDFIDALPYSRETLMIGLDTDFTF